MTSKSINVKAEHVLRMNETYTGLFCSVQSFIRAAFRWQDKLFLACQYLLNRSFQICQFHLYHLLPHNFNEIDSVQLYFLSCSTILIHKLHSATVLVIRFL